MCSDEDIDEKDLTVTSRPIQIQGRGCRVIHGKDEPPELVMQFDLSQEYDEEKNAVLGKPSLCRKYVEATKPCVVSARKVWMDVHAMKGRVHLKEREFFEKNVILTIELSEHKRPVRFFWGVHDFVRGLRGALLGHEYLTKVGILHRDIREESIVLARRLGGERGFLIDPDIDLPHHKSENNVFCSRRYTSVNVLFNGTHTYHDDMESFFYVLLLFFFNYRGPLSQTLLRHADFTKFVDHEDTLFAHYKLWPGTFRHLAHAEDFDRIAKTKDKLLQMNQSRPNIWLDVKEHIEKYWRQEELKEAIVALLETSTKLFRQSRADSHDDRGLRCTRVDHRTFIGVLDMWLETYAHLEDKFSPCPFREEYVRRCMLSRQGQD